MDVTHKTPVAILISGRGTNMMALVKAVQSGQLDADIRLALSNKADAPGLQFAKQMNIPTKCFLIATFLTANPSIKL